MIGVVGGGISGLFVLHFLRKRGFDVCLFEGSPRPGGVLKTQWTSTLLGGEIPLDLGPQRMRLTAGLAEVVEEVGLTPSLLFVQKNQPFMMAWKGGLHPAPTSFGAAFSTPLISWQGKIRALADLLTAPPAPEESVAHALSRKLGPEVYERLAGPILGGLYGSDPEQMEARHTLLPAMKRTGSQRSLLRALRKTSRWTSLPAVSFREGMGALSDGLSELHRDWIRFDTPVRGIREIDGGGFLLESEVGNIPVEEVILTLPAPEAGKVMRPLSTTVSDRLAGLRYNPLAVIHLLLPEGGPLPKMGSGFKTTLRDPLLTRGVTAHGALFGKESGRERLFTAFLGGMGREEILEMSEEELREMARTDFRSVTKTDPIPVAMHRTWMPAWDRSWHALDDLHLPKGMHLCSAFSGRPGIPGRLEDARQVVARIESSLH